MFIRPFPITEGLDTFNHFVGKESNNHRPDAGKGIKITRFNNGYQISATQVYHSDKMVYKGLFDPNIEYLPYDVVFVDPNNSIYSGSYTIGTNDSSGSSCNLTPGLWICIKHVPDAGMTSTLLENVVAGNMAKGYGSITTEFADSYRHSGSNVYFPVYPLIPTSSVKYVAESGGGLNWTYTANDTFWYPLSPMIQTQVCSNGISKNIWVNGITSGSKFDNSRLPYKGS